MLKLLCLSDSSGFLFVCHVGRFGRCPLCISDKNINFNDIATPRHHHGATTDEKNILQLSFHPHRIHVGYISTHIELIFMVFMYTGKCPMGSNCWKSQHPICHLETSKMPGPKLLTFDPSLDGIWTNAYLSPPRAQWRCYGFRDKKGVLEKCDHKKRGRERSRFTWMLSNKCKIWKLRISVANLQLDVDKNKMEPHSMNVSTRMSGFQGVFIKKHCTKRSASLLLMAEIRLTTWDGAKTL